MLFPYIIFGNEVVVKGFELAKRQFFNAVFNGSYQLFAPAFLVSAKMSKYLVHVYSCSNLYLLPLNCRWRFRRNIVTYAVYALYLTNNLV